MVAHKSHSLLFSNSLTIANRQIIIPKMMLGRGGGAGEAFCMLHEGFMFYDGPVARLQIYQF